MFISQISGIGTILEETILVYMEIIPCFRASLFDGSRKWLIDFRDLGIFFRLIKKKKFDSKHSSNKTGS